MSVSEIDSQAVRTLVFLFLVMAVPASDYFRERCWWRGHIWYTSRYTQSATTVTAMMFGDSHTHSFQPSPIDQCSRCGARRLSPGKGGF